MKAPTPVSKPQLAAAFLVIFTLLLLAMLLIVMVGSILGVALEWLAFPILLVSIVGLAALLIVKQKRTHRFLEGNLQAVARTNQGDFDGAARALDDLIARTARYRTLRALLILNRSTVWTLQGDPAQALELSRPLLDGAWHTSGLRHQAGAVVNAVALPLALLGRLDEAVAILSANLPGLNAAQRPNTLAARVILAARRERWEEALALISSEATAAEGVLAARNLRMLSSIAAFVGERSGQPIHPLRWPLATADELRFITLYWPAFGAWLSASESQLQSSSSPLVGAAGS